MSFLERVRTATLHNADHYRPLRVGGEIVGYIKSVVEEVLREGPPIFSFDAPEIEFLPEFEPEALRSRALNSVLPLLREAGFARAEVGELFDVAASLGGTPRLTVDRSAVEAFGFITCGFHLNGIVGEEMWIARRSLTKPTFPGELDNMVAGGWPRGLSLADNVRKECAEEADIPADLASEARPVGVMTYVMEVPGGLRRHAMYLFDLEVPADFLPRIVDGEVESFHLLPIDEVQRLVRETEEFKYNSAVSIIDHLIRSGRITPTNPEYELLIRGMHQSLVPSRQSAPQRVASGRTSSTLRL